MAASGTTQPIGPRGRSSALLAASESSRVATAVQYVCATYTERRGASDASGRVQFVPRSSTITTCVHLLSRVGKRLIAYATGVCTRVVLPTVL